MTFSISTPCDKLFRLWILAQLNWLTHGAATVCSFASYANAKLLPQLPAISPHLRPLNTIPSQPRPLGQPRPSFRRFEVALHWHVVSFPQRNCHNFNSNPTPLTKPNGRISLWLSFRSLHLFVFPSCLDLRKSLTNFNDNFSITLWFCLSNSSTRCVCVIGVWVFISACIPQANVYRLNSYYIIYIRQVQAYHRSKTFLTFIFMVYFIYIV